MDKKAKIASSTPGLSFLCFLSSVSRVPGALSYFGEGPWHTNNSAKAAGFHYTLWGSLRQKPQEEAKDLK